MLGAGAPVTVRSVPRRGPVRRRRDAADLGGHRARGHATIRKCLTAARAAALEDARVTGVAALARLRVGRRGIGERHGRGERECGREDQSGDVHWGQRTTGHCGSSAPSATSREVRRRSTPRRGIRHAGSCSRPPRGSGGPWFPIRAFRTAADDAKPLTPPDAHSSPGTDAIHHTRPARRPRSCASR